MTKDVGQVKDVVIYDQYISKFFEDAIMIEHDALHIINFTFITVIFKGASTLPLSVCITFIFTVKTGKLSHTFRIIPLIIPFDRGCVYYCFNDPTNKESKFSSYLLKDSFSNGKH